MAKIDDYKNRMTSPMGIQLISPKKATKKATTKKETTKKKGK